jgi:hypothetical protein
VRQRLPPDAVIASNFASTVYLHTGRRGTDVARTYDAERFLDHLLRRGVTHLLLWPERPFAPGETPDANDWTPQARRMAAHTAWYRAAGRAGDADVYEIAADSAAFLSAFERLLAGEAAAARGDAAGAEREWREALRRLPSMTGARGRLAQLAAGRGDWARAERELAAALAVWPDDPALRYHRELVRSRRSGRPPDLSALADDARRCRHWPLIWKLR